jgi:hypothetical protein
MGAIPLVVILDDVLDALELLFARSDVFCEVVEVAIRLASVAINLVGEVMVSGYEIADDLVCHDVLPVGAGHLTVPQQDLCRGKVFSAIV